MSAAATTISIDSTASTYAHLHDLMSCYELKDLVNVTPDVFIERIRQFAADAPWGHHHDFGSFCMSGRMCKHHLSMIRTFIDELDAMPLRLDGQRVLDVGCWSGGTSLLLCAMGAEVVAVETVPEFAVGADYLRYAFDIERLHVHPMSLYDCTTSEFLNHFDYVLVAGVLHHLTDPKLALRILYNCLRDGGTCLVETNSTEYEHVSNQSSHREPPCDRMFFTPDNLTTLMEDVGFDMRIRPRPIQYRTPEPRLFGAGRRPVGAT